MRNLHLASVILLVVGSVVEAAPGDLERVLAFEGDHAGGAPAGWSAYPRNTVHVDDREVHGGTWSARIERGAASDGKFTALSKALPVEFGGKKIELRGFLRTETVAGFAGLWLRLDGEQGPLAIDNMERQNLHGTTDWAEYRVTLELRPAVRSVHFGALLSGEGRVWVDDLQLLVDGEPVEKAPRTLPAPPPARHVADGSGIALTELTAAQVRNLALLGKVWGFLKYHHPYVASGKWNWDDEVFGVMPEVVKAGDAAAGNAAILAWCRRVGPAPDGDPPPPAVGEIHLRPALDWIRDTDALGAELSGWLRAVYEHRHAGGPHYYVSAASVGNPDFGNEDAYASLDTPDAGYRILALYRFWNIVEYWFPYRDVIGEDWDRVLAGFLPRLVAAQSGDAYRLEMLALIAMVHDTHANLWSSLDARPPRGPASLPVCTRFIEGRAVVVGSASSDGAPCEGLQVGDVILSIDGRPVDALVEAWRPFYAASNEPTRLRDIGRSLTRGEPGPCKLRVERDGQPMETTVDRVPAGRLDPRAGMFHDRPGETFQKLSADVAYLKLSSVKEGDVDACLREAKGTKGLVIDIRNYPSTFVVWTLGQRLVRKPTPFARFTRCDLGNPGAFYWGAPLVLEPRGEPYEGRVVILIDEVSQSQAEYTTMALRVAPGAVVVGSTTAGADGNVSPIPLPGGLRTMISGLGVFYPDKTPTQRVGILADVQVRPTLAGIRAGRDEVLEEGLHQILGDSVSAEEIVRMAKR